MNKPKLISKIIVFVALGIFITSFIPSSQAGMPPFIDPPPGQYIGYYPWDGRSISASEYSYFRVGFGYTTEEIENNWWPKNPYRVRLFFDGVEIPLRRFTLHNTEEEEPKHWWFFYQIFKPGYFTPNDHIVVRIEVYVHGSYLGSDSNEWRHFINFGGPAQYGPIPFPWTLEHFIHIID